MWFLIKNINRSLSITTNSLALQNGLNDQENSCSFSITDPGCLIDINAYDEVVVLDDKASYTQTHNFVVDPLFAQTTTKYRLAGGLQSLLLFNGSPTVSATLNNNAIDTGTASQTSLINLVQPGITYYFSLYVQTLVTLVGGYAFLQLSFLDNQMAVIANSVITSTNLTNVASRTRFTLQGTAPSNAVFARITFGITTTSATNSGNVLFSSPQLEAAHFDYAGQLYPTADCLPGNINCNTLPNGTTVRQARLFAGTINKYKAIYDGNNRNYDIQCAHLSELLELKLVNKTYTNSSDSQIIADVLGSSYVGLLTGNTVLTGKIFDSISFDDHTFKEVLNTFAENTAYLYGVSNYGDVFYAPPYTMQVPFRFSDTVLPDYITVFPLTDYEFEDDFTQKASRVKARGGKYTAPDIVETFSGNGSNKVFTLSQQPTSVRSVTVGGTSQKTGIQGVNTLGTGGIVALVDKANSKLTFQNAPASGTNNVSITYNYDANVYIQEDDVNSQARYGVAFERKLQDTALLSIQAASSRAIQELIQFANPRIALTAKTTQYLAPGHAVLVTSSRDKIYNQLLLTQTVKTVSLGADMYEYEVQLGAYMPDIVDRFKNYQKSGGRSRSTAGQPIQATNLFVMDQLFFGGESISATAQYVQAKYGQARWGYASYGPISAGGSPAPGTYGSSSAIYGTTTWG